MLRKNQKITLQIDGMTAEGSGVGHFNGQAVFVQNTAIGDIIECHVILAKKTYAVGKIEKIITPSGDRITPDCKVAGQCGGCCFRHINYEAELRYKEQKVRDAFLRIGHLDIIPEPIIGAPKIDGYRNKAQLPIARDLRSGNPLIGFYAFNTHRVVPYQKCRLQPPVFADIIAIVENWIKKYDVSIYNENTHTGLLRHLFMREARSTGEIMTCLVINGEDVPHKEALLSELQFKISKFKTFLLNINREKSNVILGGENKPVFGDGYIEDILLEKRFRISPLSFYQVNSEQCEVLYKKAAEYASCFDDKTELLLDLYCGTGTIGLTMADKAEKFIGIEVIPDAISDAKKNAEQNGINNAEFFCGDAAETVARLKSRGGVLPDVILADPPRKGLSVAMVDLIAGIAPKRVVYVSCDPATLARDCARLVACGFTVERAQPVDMFPRTAHVECIALIQRVKS